MVFPDCYPAPVLGKGVFHFRAASCGRGLNDSADNVMGLLWKRASNSPAGGEGSAQDANGYRVTRRVRQSRRLKAQLFLREWLGFARGSAVSSKPKPPERT